MIRVPESAKRDLLQVCKRLYERGLVAGADGNVSIRISKQHLLATPTGMSKGFIGPEDLVVCDLAGKQLEGTRRLTTEIKIHLAAYTEREDVCAVVHAHPPFATAFAVAGMTPSETLMPEAYIAVGRVALAPYGTPSTDELSERLRASLREHDSVLLANHGAMTLGRDVTGAYHRMEALEQLCRITTITRTLGSARALGAEEIAKLDAIRGVYGGTSSDAPCWHCGRLPEPYPAKRHSGGATRSGDGDGGGASGGVDRDAGGAAPAVHWPGNPPVWQRPDRPPAIEEDRVRDLARRALRELRRE
jgi:L-fuculose-phosphate aldolase